MSVRVTQRPTTVCYAMQQGSAVRALLLVSWTCKCFFLVPRRFKFGRGVGDGEAGRCPE